MSVAQATKTSVKEVTHQQSVALMKNLTRAALSEICFIRNLFPEEVFRLSTFGNTSIRALCPRELDNEGKPTGNIINNDAFMLTKWQEAAFDALERGYLRSIVLGIYSAEDDPEARKLIESYVFNFKYPSSGEIELTLENDKEAFSMARVRDEAVTMVRTLIRLAETMKPIPEERYISLKLFYYDEIVPSNYQPEYFTDATNEEHQFFDTAPLKLTLGTVQSKHHSISLKVAFREDLSNDTIDPFDTSNTIATVTPSLPGHDTTHSTVVTPSGIQSSTAGLSSSVNPPYPIGSNSMSTHAVTDQKFGSTVAHPLLDGVDRHVYECACRLIVSSPYWTVKGFVDGLKTMTIPSSTIRSTSSSSSSSNTVSFVPIDVSQEQARRLLKQLENDGYMKRTGPASSTKYEVTKAGFDQGTTLSSSSVSHGSTVVRTGTTAVVPFTDPAQEAASWFHRGIVAVLGNYSIRTTIKTVHIEYELGLEASIARAVIHHLESLNIVGKTGSQGVAKRFGRPILWNDQSISLLNDAEEYLRTHNLPRPLPPKPEAVTEPKVSLPSSVPTVNESENVPPTTPVTVSATPAKKGNVSKKTIHNSTPVTPLVTATTVATVSHRKRSTRMLDTPIEDTVLSSESTPLLPSKKRRTATKTTGKNNAKETVETSAHNAIMAALSQSSTTDTPSLLPTSGTKIQRKSSSSSSSTATTTNFTGGGNWKSTPNVWLSKPTPRTNNISTEISPAQAGMDANWI